MPNKRSFLTKIGKNSLYIYVLHFYFSELSKKFLKSDPMSFLTNDPLLGPIYCILLTALLIITLSSSPVEKSMEKLINLVTKTFVKS
jgi:fucose 4-O-acetylase-like acetyltransferase